jgi:hypothetical protein
MERQVNAARILFPMLCILLSTGCGKKVWPEPAAHEDSFSWENIESKIHDDCLTIHARLAGAADNLLRLELELESGEDGCPTCPFTPTQVVEPAMDSPQIHRQGKAVTIRYCPIPAQKPFRWRLVGYNIFPVLPPAKSTIQTSSAP